MHIIINDLNPMVCPYNLPFFRSGLAKENPMKNTIFPQTKGLINGTLIIIFSIPRIVVVGVNWMEQSTIQAPLKDHQRMESVLDECKRTQEHKTEYLSLYSTLLRED